MWINEETKQVFEFHSDIRKSFPRTSFPSNLTDEVLSRHNVSPVLETPKPTAGQYQNAVRNGVEKDAKGNWVWAWAIRDMFSDYTDEAGVLHTKAAQEAAYQAGLNEKAAEGVRTKRDKMIADTDWMALSDNTLTPAWATYRQALRDITNHVNFPYLTNADWPTKP